MKDVDIYVTETGKTEISAGSVTAIMRVYFSSYHLWAASHFRHLTGLREKAVSKKPIFDVQHRAYVTNSILSSVAFLEAAINELYQDSYDQHESYLKSLCAEDKKRIAFLWQLTEENNKAAFSILEKYQLALVMAGKPELSTGAKPYQDAALVIKIRNELMHYKPKSLGGELQHKLEKQLKAKFPENELMAESGNPYFPDKCLGYGCATWAVKSVIDFANRVFDELNVQPNYQMVRFIPAPEVPPAV
jgi:hypothetical protein